MMNKNKLFTLIAILGVCAPQVSLANGEESKTANTDCTAVFSKICHIENLMDKNDFRVNGMDGGNRGCPDCGYQCNCGRPL